MNAIPTRLLAWIAGFIDADGCINAQIVKREDYILKYQVRVYITVHQSTRRHHLIKRMEKLFGKGTVRKRNDGISEFALVGAEQVKPALIDLLPYLWLKKAQANLLLKIMEKLPYVKDPLVLLEICMLADKIGTLNDSKMRVIKTAQVRETLRSMNYDI